MKSIILYKSAQENFISITFVSIFLSCDKDARRKI